MTMPPRLVTVLVPLQLATVFLGFAICRKFIHLRRAVFQDESLRSWQDNAFPMPTSVWFLSEAYWLLLLLPIVWGLVACLRAESVGTITEIRSLDSQVGIGMLVLLAGFAGWSALRSIAWATTIVGPTQLI